MPNLITNATEDTESSEIVATSDIIVTVTGKMPQGRVRFSCDIGGGRTTILIALTELIKKIGIVAGTKFKACLEGTDGVAGTDVTVSYIFSAEELPEGFCILIDDSSNQLIDDNGDILVAPCV